MDQRATGPAGRSPRLRLGDGRPAHGVAGNLVLTPFIIHGLGDQRFGIFVLVVTLTGMLTSFDGGVRAPRALFLGVRRD